MPYSPGTQVHLHACLSLSIHKAPFGAARRASLYAGPDGRLSCAELYDRRGRARDVKPGTPMWAAMVDYAARMHALEIRVVEAQTLAAAQRA